jgi:TP901 family phage tail tape measure protein
MINLEKNYAGRATPTERTAVMPKPSLKQECVMLNETGKRVTAMQNVLAKLDFEENQIFDMTKPILNFATATGADPIEAAQLAGIVIRLFDFKSCEITRVVTVMTMGIAKSALSFSYLQIALPFIAPFSKIMGLTIEKTVAQLGTLADSGLDASSAATVIRNLLIIWK